VVEKQHKVWFSKALKNWHLVKNMRKMPWKGIKDPYKIWLSEIILQQTRVEQGLAYYNRFIEAYPDVHSLAKAADNQVFKLWEGLGYYSRCRNLIKTARTISLEHGGHFPASKEGLLSLSGVGSYTAAAIGSFAFGLPLAVVDGNVLRVLSRVFGISTPIDLPAGRKLFEQLAEQLLDAQDPALYNQAIMDLGATVCKPRQPLCEECPFQQKCEALKSGTIEQLPVKSKKIKQKERFFYYLVLESEGKQLVRQRKGKDIWQDLFEYVLKETDEPCGEKDLKSLPFWNLGDAKGTIEVLSLSEEMVHQLTHQKIRCRIAHLRISAQVKVEGYQWMDIASISQLAFPRLITRYQPTIR
jgi:A/G-specific adenine glycosylase